MNYLFFYGVKDPYGFCSNFYRHSMKIDGITWPSVEHYFQAMKFKNVSNELFELIRKAESPFAAKVLGSQRKNPKLGEDVNKLVDRYKHIKIRSDWEKVKIYVIIDGLLAKFSDPVFRKKLTAIPDNTLMVEHTENDSVWGDGSSGDTVGKGSNYLGKILTVIAHILKYGSCDKMSKELKQAVRIGKNGKGGTQNEVKIPSPRKPIIAYTDGSAVPNPGIGGWAWIAIIDGKEVSENGGKRVATNNQMELTAVIRLLQAFPESKEFTIHTDSEWTMNCAKGLWKRKMNLDLWKEYDEASKGKKITWVKVLAHSGIELNEKVDRLANAGRAKA